MVSAAVARDLLGSLEHSMAKVRSLADRAGVRLEARLPADPSLIDPDDSEFVRLAPAVLALAIGRSRCGGDLYIGLEVTDDLMIRLEVAEPALFARGDEDRCAVVGPDAMADRLPGAIPCDLDHLTSIGGRLLDCGVAEHVHLILVIPNCRARAP